MKPILILGGPTASGKSALALTIAKEQDAVIINGDSQQVYHEIPVITAQPSNEEQAQVPHRLYGHISVTDHYSMGRWLEEAVHEITAAHAADKLPIIVGGTGMYLRALTEGVADIPAIDPQIREGVQQMHAAIGNLIFYQLLKKRDPIVAKRLEPGDTQRMLRAFEVIEQTGESITYFQEQAPKAPVAAEQCGCFRIMPDREALYAQCNERFEQMTKHGALDEVEALETFPDDAPGMKALGVSELRAYVAGDSTLDEVIARAQQQTRRYAKRQLTWFRNQCADWPLIETPHNDAAQAQIREWVASLIVIRDS